MPVSGLGLGKGQNWEERRGIVLPGFTGKMGSPIAVIAGPVSSANFGTGCGVNWAAIAPKIGGIH
jgi:hypothetical protein